MARARSLKPGFFTNDVLAEVQPLGRLLFAGLWTIADRAGRLEERPRKIKVEILPFDRCDIEKLLGELTSRGFLVRYVVDGVRYLQITNFDKHQDPHVKERLSTIPPPCEHGASTVQKPLTPDSPFRTPDSSPDARAESPSVSAKPEGPNPPPGVLPHVWRDWQRHRGKKLSDVSIRRQTDRLAELQVMGHEPNAVILQSIERGWSGLFELKERPRTREPTLAEKRARNMEILTGKVRDERAIEGVAERVGGAVVLALPSDLRQSDGDDVGRLGPERSATGVG